MDQKKGMHCYVIGLVQGVWFRASTQDQANKLGLTGWVRNLPDSRVEVFAYGEKAELLRLYEWLKQGPPAAKVLEVTYEEVSWEPHERFAVL
jgi:acylphosphatase